MSKAELAPRVDAHPNLRTLGEAGVRAETDGCHIRALAWPPAARDNQFDHLHGRVFYVPGRPDKFQVWRTYLARINNALGAVPAVLPLHGAARESCNLEVSIRAVVDATSSTSCSTPAMMTRRARRPTVSISRASAWCRLERGVRGCPIDGEDPNRGRDPATTAARAVVGWARAGRH